MENRYFMVLWKRVIYILKIFENHILMDFGLIFQFILVLERIFESWYFIHSQIYSFRGNDYHFEITNTLCYVVNMIHYGLHIYLFFTKIIHGLINQSLW
jgi:hypothetical protein